MVSANRNAFGVRCSGSSGRKLRAMYANNDRPLFFVCTMPAKYYTSSALLTWPKTKLGSMRASLLYLDLLLCAYITVSWLRPYTRT